MACLRIVTLSVDGGAEKDLSPHPTRFSRRGMITEVMLTGERYFYSSVTLSHCSIWRGLGFGIKRVNFDRLIRRW